MSAKHGIEKRKKRHLKFLVFFTILIIIAFVLYIFTNISSEIKKDIVKDDGLLKTSNNSTFELIEITNQSDIKNSNSLLVNGINIAKSANSKYMVSSTVNNNSSENQEKISVVLHLYNSNKAEITTLIFSLDNILANGKSTLFTISDIDLSDCKYYYIAIKE